MNTQILILFYLVLIIGLIMYFKPEDTTSNFDSIMQQSDLPAISRDSVIIFFAPWCGHCVRAKPEFEKAQRGGRGDIHLIDITDPDNKKIVEKYQISSFPTIMKPDGTKYNGPRTAEEILEFKDQK
jgi:thiol-disulfide isomerase/thioredoxin